MQKIHLTYQNIELMAYHLSQIIRAEHPRGQIKLYGIPRGGIPVAYLLSKYDPITITDNPDDATAFVDDIIDSGRTSVHWRERYPHVPFYALINKMNPHSPMNGAEAFKYAKEGWIVFPWEQSVEHSADDIVVRMLQFIGEDPTREGLLETPKRVLKAWGEWFDGYKMNEQDIFKVFEDGAEKVDSMVIVKDIPVESFCEHHIARFHGYAHVGYIPDGKIVGLSKLARIVRMYSHRLQVQERLTVQIADSIERNLCPLGVGVVIQAEHTCMSSRGARVHGTSTITSAMRGTLREEPSCRAEFMALIKGE